MNNKYQEALDGLKEGRLSINRLCGKWLPREVIDNLEDYGEYEIFQYFDLSCFEELVKKETSMEVNMEDYHLEDEYQYPIYSCPKCGKHINDEDNYCRHCGQKLDWSEE
jgi:predicted RNA-binding Zn-ribbon protein involved in translation (DUF1610 family)